jgi:hypothetical protein
VSTEARETQAFRSPEEREQVFSARNKKINVFHSVERDQINFKNSAIAEPLRTIDEP